MNAYTTRSQARMHLHDVSAVLRADGLPAGAALATLEWHRGYQADAEEARLLRRHNGTQGRAAWVTRLRERIGAVLIRVGERLAGVPGRGVSPEPVPAVGPIVTAG
jgi:hypothetical protein